MKKGMVLICVLTAACLGSSCASFLKDRDVASLKEYEQKIYTLKKDVGEGEHFLPKGRVVKIFLKTTGDYIKVYCYPPEVEFVRAPRVLMLYLFEDDFDKKLFDRKRFEDRLFGLVDLKVK